MTEILAEAPARNRRRRAIAFLAGGALLATGIGTASNALFTDVETTPNNTFTAGTLDLTAGQTAVTSVNFDNLAPGDAEQRQVSVANAGSLDLKYNGSLVVHATQGKDRDGSVARNAAGVLGQKDSTDELDAGPDGIFGTADDVKGTEYDRDAPGGKYLPISVDLKNAKGDTVWSVANLATFIADPANASSVSIDATTKDATITLPQSAFATQYLASDADKHTYADPAVEAALNGAGKHVSDTLTADVKYLKAVDGQGKDVSQNGEQGASASLDFTFSAVQVANNS